MRLLSVLLTVALPAVATGQEAPPGALSCTGCHDGAVETALSLQGLSAEDIMSAMADFASGAREATLMGRIAAGFTDAETEAIAQWIAGGTSR